MKDFKLSDSSGNALDATFSTEGSNVWIHARGGSQKGVNKGLNPDYSRALRAFLERSRNAKASLDSVYVDSRPVQPLPIGDRTVLSGSECTELSVDEMLSRISSRVSTVGQDGTQRGGNSSKRLAFRFAHDLPAAFFGGIGVIWGTRKNLLRPASDFGGISALHILQAIRETKDGTIPDGFEESTGYDLLLDDGTRLSPKVVFGVAAQLATGRIFTGAHFKGGEGSLCFRELERAGYQIVQKGGSGRDQRIWIEGNPVVREHKRRERASGLRAAKLADFKEKNGRLFCEKCKMDPFANYPEELAEAAIEVHHSATEVANMPPAYETELSDLQCLCANCHRIEHARLRARNT